jgi:hypothetical protein
MASIRDIVEQHVREVFADLGIPSEYAKVALGPLHPLDHRSAAMKPKPKPPRRPRPGY